MKSLCDHINRLGLDPVSTSSDDREELIYSIAASELSSRQAKPGLMAQAFAESGGNEQASAALYINLRASQLRREWAALAREEKAIRRAERESLQDNRPLEAIAWLLLILLLSGIGYVAFSP